LIADKTGKAGSLGQCDCPFAIWSISNHRRIKLPAEGLVLRNSSPPSSRNKTQFSVYRLNFDPDDAMFFPMNEQIGLPRSPELMSRGDTALLVVDVQEKLVPAIHQGGRVVWIVRRLIDGATILGLPVFATEQYPQGLGPTVPELAERLDSAPSKLTFSCGGCPEFYAALGKLRERGIHKILVCGIEAHVCVQQTVLDLLADAWRVYVAADAVGSRFEMDDLIALGRMDSAGATLTTTEAALFEWCEVAGTPEFKQISRLAREEAGS
jgi:nicotinamidase-related amidase